MNNSQVPKPQPDSTGQSPASASMPDKKSIKDDRYYCRGSVGDHNDRYRQFIFFRLERGVSSGI
jgi:hypothetical protein